MRVRLLASSDTLLGVQETVFDGIIPDYRFAPDVITINGQQTYKFSYQIREGDEFVGIYRAVPSHNIVVTAPTTSVPQEVSNEH